MILLDLQSKELEAALELAIANSGDPRAAFDEVGQEWVRSINRNFRAGGRPNKWAARKGGGKSTLQASGGLQRSVTARTLVDGVQVGTRKRHAALHHHGGTIKPRRAKYLSIPLPGTPKSVGAAGAGALFRRYPDRAFTLFREPGKGTVLLAPASGKGKPRAMFVLRKSVKITARPFLLAQDNDADEFVRILLTHATGGLVT